MRGPNAKSHAYYISDTRRQFRRTQMSNPQAIAPHNLSRGSRRNHDAHRNSRRPWRVFLKGGASRSPCAAQDTKSWTSAPHQLDPGDDYPDFIIPLARAVAAGEVERGVALCGSGVGASIAANKVPGVRAGLIHDVFSAHQGVEDDDMNVFCLGGKVIGSALALELIETFLTAHFSGAVRASTPPGKSAGARRAEDLACSKEWAR